MKERNISVIIVTYNASSTINRCLESVYRQTYSNFEVIIVDDGSEDNTKKICAKYVQVDKRFKLISQPNQGVSVARQKGINAATGEYVIWVDSDDYIEHKMLSCLVSKITESNSDVAVCDFYKCFPDKILVETHPCCGDKIDGITFLNHIIRGDFMGVLWNKLIKKEYWERILFDPQITFGEDVLVLSDILPKCKEIVFYKKPLYYYSIYSNSISHRNSKLIYLNRLQFLDRLEVKIESFPEIEKDFVTIRKLKALVAMEKSSLFTIKELLQFSKGIKIGIPRNVIALSILKTKLLFYLLIFPSSSNLIIKGLKLIKHQIS